MSHHAITVTGDVVLALAWIPLYLFTMRRWTPERGREEARKWADKRHVVCDEAWLDPVQRQLRTNLQADLVALFFMFYALNVAPLSMRAYAALLVSASYVWVIARGLDISRQILPPGPRVARARQVTAGDYLPSRTRRLAWASAVAGLAACLALGSMRDSRVVAAAGLVLLLPPGAIEWAGARLARMPQPADSAANLYLQDAFRSDLLRFASLRFALAATTLTGYLGVATLTGSPAWVPAVLMGGSLLLYIPLFRDLIDLREDPDDHLRARLWRGVALS